MPSNSARQRKWLREASMRRLSQLVKDKTELIDSAQKLRINIHSVEGLEASGLNKQMIQHLENWVEGVESGRECMFALLDSMHSIKDIAPPAKASQFKPMDVVQSLLNLPEQFLCDNGYLFEKVFSRPPATVVKEAVQIIVKKAEEQNSSSLGLQQINLALKQLRLDAMCSSNPIVEPVVPSVEESVAENFTAEDSIAEKTMDLETPAIDDQGRQQITMRVKIITELLRIHIRATTKRKYGSTAQRKRRQPEFVMWDETVDTDEDNADLADVDLRSLREFVSTPVQQVQQQAMESPAESLEQTNTLLKPYLRRLSALKMLLSTQLNEIRDSKAFLSLGLSPDATDEDIKRAYRILAVRLHPDKPGGDTAKFQQLQAMYQEVLKRRKTKRDEEETIQQMREKRQQEQSNLRNHRHKKQQHQNENKDDENVLNSSLEQEDKELEELLRNIDKDLQNDAKELAEFAKQKKELSKKGGLSDDKDEEEESSYSSDEEDKENLQDGSESEASSSLEKENDKQSKKQKNKVKDTENVENFTENPEMIFQEKNETLHPQTEKSRKEDLTVEDVDIDSDGNSASFAKTSLAKDTRHINKTQPQGSRFAAILLNVSLPEKPMGPFDSNETHAAALIAHTQQLLPVLHQAATRATHATQKLVKWQKQWDKTFRDSSLSLSQLMDHLLQTATQALGGHVPFIEHISCPSLSTTAANAAVTHAWGTTQDTHDETQRHRLLTSLIRAVAPSLEVVCDVTQRVAATAMELATDCGTDYAQTIGLESDFLKIIEETMNESLACLRGVVPIASSLDQLMTCLQRSYDTHRLTVAHCQSTTLLDMLIEMMRTALKNTVATHCGAVDSLMQAAQAVTHLTDRLKLLQEKVSRNMLQEAKRQADYERMRQEEEDEYSAEDREAMKRARQQQQPASNASQSDETNGQTDAEKKQNSQDDEDDKNLSGLDLLKNKIRKLQVQLYLQQVAALQTMNAETVTLQDNILQELQSLTLLVPNKSQSPEKSFVIQGVNSAVVESVVSLVAEMLDASLAQFRVLYQRHRPSLLLQDTLPTSNNNNVVAQDVCTKEEVNWELRRHLDLEYVSDTLKKHLDWCVNVVLSDFSYVSLRDLLVQAQFVVATASMDANESADTAETETDKEREINDETVPKPTKMMPKVALLPDYRAKTLYLASVLDLPAIKHLLFSELPQKLQEILSE